MDGFRFDLASIFTRNSDGTVNLEDPPVIGEISADRDRFENVRLIAEALGCSRSYQLGPRLSRDDVAAVERPVP